MAGANIKSESKNRRIRAEPEKLMIFGVALVPFILAL